MHTHRYALGFAFKAQRIQNMYSNTDLIYRIRTHNIADGEDVRSTFKFFDIVPSKLKEIQFINNNYRYLALIVL